jgi:hypothetical protein
LKAVMERSVCTLPIAIDALKKCEGDWPRAVMLLKKK